jgi:hypothetical protein
MDINQGAFTLNGHLFSGWSDATDCLSFPDAAVVAEFKKGASGSMIATRTGERGGKVEVKLLANSPSAAFMAKLIKNQEAGLPIVYHGDWINPVAGENVNLSGGALITCPKGTTYGKGDVGEKVYVFEFEQIGETPETSLLASAVSLGTALL